MKQQMGVGVFDFGQRPSNNNNNISAFGQAFGFNLLQLDSGRNSPVQDKSEQRTTTAFADMLMELNNIGKRDSIQAV